MQTNKAENEPIAVFRVTDFGARPDTGEDATKAIQSAIDAASAVKGPVIIDFPQGRYDLYPDHASKEVYYVSNTASEQENPDPTKTIGLLFKGASRFSLEGNGSLLLFHGKMTPLVLDGCADAEIRNLHIDYARPTISEMRITAIGERHWDVEVHPDSPYMLQDGKLIWTGEGWTCSEGPAQEYDPCSNRTWRVPNPAVLASHVEEIETGKLRLSFPSAPRTEIGHVFQTRDGIRDQVGTLIVACRNIVWRNVGMRYMHGLGIVGQLSENLTFDRLRLAPHPSSGRTAAAFADFMHFSANRGKIAITGSVFEGAHDDAINVHGTHLRIVGKAEADRSIRVRFMHPQSYGFPAFQQGDVVDFISASKLTPYATCTVVAVSPISLREMELTLDEPLPENMAEGDVIENVTWTPEVHIQGNHFKRIPTRGVLVTTRRKVIIEDNLFEGTQMSAVLIADDAASWFESGMVQDVHVRGNRIISCGEGDEPVIFIHPENTVVSAGSPVHCNITIEGNDIEMAGPQLLNAKSARNLILSGNRITFGDRAAEKSGMDRKAHVQLLACSEVRITNNAFDSGTAATVTAVSMTEEDVMVGAAQPFVVTFRGK
ncbi:alpha-1,3-galactosidase-related protein [Paenibacillus mendelii]|uniref:Glycosyl hydrolase family 28-related protein n=1 Tax=Paenibacillus mendelii TaxID=206163 RepID=A0ABV6J4N3_9BACL|nr:right-handed parallel beta-helix repeat-containing protein [Paenibacillus mendelii]MCQ6561736.1 right-handed parallel beta-helix repeat-containing protein [Paenibacillus mendelii]